MRDRRHVRAAAGRGALPRQRERASGGFSRALVFWLPGQPRCDRDRAGLARPAAGLQPLSLGSAALPISGTAVAAVLCATVALPGVIDQDDLDAKPVNAFAATGVVLALLLTVRGRPARTPRRPTARQDVDPSSPSLRPWSPCHCRGSEPRSASTSIQRPPLLGRVYLASEVRPEPGQPDLRAVRASRRAPRARRRPARGDRPAPAARGAGARATGAAGRRRDVRVADGRLRRGGIFPGFWLEQLFKRGTTTLTLPGVLTPALSGAWAVLLVAAAVVYVGFSRPAPVRWESESPARSVWSSSSRRSSRWARTSSPCRTSPA